MYKIHVKSEERERRAALQKIIRPKTWASLLKKNCPTHGFNPTKSNPCTPLIETPITLIKGLV